MAYMRIIAGEAKGIRLNMVPGSHVRPTTDRVKESLFHMIGHFFASGEVLDMFAGTGSLGIEALSRGMDHCVFVDQSAQSAKTIHMNLEKSKLRERAEIMKQDARVVCRWLAKQQRQFDLIFLDPPYQLPILLPIMKQLTEGNLLKPDGTAVIETPHTMELPSNIGDWVIDRQKKYGNIHLTFYHCRGKKEE